MGIYDRDYYRDERSGTRFGDQSMVINLIIANVALYLVNIFTDNNWLTDHMAAEVQDVWHPWMWWRFVSSGFAHSPQNIWHIVFNMVGLFFFGRPVEQIYGRAEFLRLYLVMLVFATVCWCLFEWAIGAPPWAGVIGASGAVTGVVILFALHYPNATMLLFFVVPVPAWVGAVLFVLLDFYFAIQTATGQPASLGAENDVANTAHLAGAAFAFLYYRGGWNLGRLAARFYSPAWFRRKPRLKVHDPADREERPLQERVDAILDKINREGEASLTREERNTLEEASRRYQRRRR